MSEQKLYWISQKSTFGTGKNAICYGMEIGDKVPADMIPRFKKTGEIGALEMAKPENVNTDAAFDVVKKKLENYQASISEVLKFIKSDDNIKKAGESERDALVEMLGGLDEA